MKTLILIGAVFFGLQATAQEPDTKDLTARKAEVVKEIDERIAKLTEHKSCVTAAADKEAMKKCHEAMKEYRHGERDERKEKREERKEKRKERKENKE